MTTVSKTACPRIGGVTLNVHHWRTRSSPRVEAGLRATQGEATGIDGVPREARLTMAQHSRDDLQHDLWLCVTTHRAEHREERTVIACDHRGAQGVWWLATRRNFGGVTTLY